MLQKSVSQVACLFRQSETKWNKVMIKSLSTRPEQIQDIKTTLGKHVWEDTLQKFQDLGFTPNQLGTMLLKSPALISCSKEKLNNCPELLKALGFKTEEVKAILVQEPSIFQYEFKKLKNNYTNLLNQLGDYQGSIAALSSPKTLVESPFTTNKKIDYCIMEMYLAKPIIAKSKILQCAFNLIQTRHRFAYRAGLYKKIDPKNKEGLVNNPSVADLFFCSDEVFLTRFKGFTLEDYAVFEAMMTEENTNEGMNDEDETEDVYDKEEETPKGFNRNRSLPRNKK